MSRIKKGVAVLRKINMAYRQDRTFSPELARTNMLGTLAGYCRWNSLSDKMRKKKDAVIFAQLYEIVGNIIEEYQNSTEQGEPVENAPIWVLWWTGAENAPALVQKCIDSIQKRSGSHPVHVLDQNNIAEFLDIPGYMLDKVEKKQICLANFSDYVRYSLLNKYGGMWIDATIFQSREIPEMYFELPLFTCNASEPTAYVSVGKWTAFVFGGRKGHALFQYMQRAFEQYWNAHDAAIDYLLVDYLIRLAYENIPIVKQDIDAIPINNLHRNDLRAAMNRAESAEIFDSYLFPDTCFNKLSWRERYIEVDLEGNKTVYSEFLSRKDG